MSDAESRVNPSPANRVPPDEDARQLHRIADAVPALIAYVDADQRYRFNNEGYARWFGRAPDELRGVHIADLLGPSAYEAVRTEIEAALAGQPVSYEKLVPYERGSKWTSTHFVPDIAPDGRVLGFVALVTDITDRKRADELVARMRDQLVFAERLASVGTLAMGVAHEINNPLAIVIANQDYVITALSRLLAETSQHGGPEAAAGIAERIGALEGPLLDAHQAADRVRRIVRDLEVFASPDRTRRERVDVDRVLSSTLDALGDQVRGRCRLVETRCDVGQVEGNEALLGQVFLHLLTNAAQAVAEKPDAENEIRVATRRDQDANVVIEVADTGCGIRPEHLGRVFDPFFTTRRVGVGTGLGLWVTARIVAEMGGRIAVESQVDKGSVFTVTLPAAATP